MKLSGLLRLRTSQGPAIEFSHTCFCAGGTSVGWSAVHSIHGCKLDLVTVDEIRILVAYDGGHTLELSEEQDGYESFVAKAEQMYRFPEGWWSLLAHPAFALNEMTLFRRDPE